jgi:UDP-N-acetylmuramyl tripeptide synthase
MIRESRGEAIPALPKPSKHFRPRLSLAVAAARGAGVASALLRHGGTSLPGLVSLRIEPRAVRLLSAQLAGGSIVIAGTNGKTTTAAMTAAALVAGGRTVLHNRAGSNMMRGIAATLLHESDLRGHVRRASKLNGLFEVDEAALPAVLGQVVPDIVVLTNLFRDQLDRYGELATTADRWRHAVLRLPASATMVLNADDPLVASLGEAAPGRVLFFGIASWGEPVPDGLATPALSADTLFCPRCAAPLAFSAISYSHLGHYRCGACGFARPVPDLEVEVSAGSDGSSTLRVSYDGISCYCSVSLPGRYNVYNAAAAIAAAVAQGVHLSTAAKAVGEAPGAFGRAETVQVDGKSVRLFLVKNPTGADEVFRVVAGSDRKGPLLLLLSDNPADGEDVSWIWDARLELLIPWHGPVICGGTRAEDMALRMKYAGLSVPVREVPRDIPGAVRNAIACASSGEQVTVLATYTAMLAARGALARRGYVAQYWRRPS